jgi:DNA invertase Pin-like site-specific DNA recombinase
MNAVIYARVSTDQQENENQLAQLRRFALAQGWAIIHEFLDEETGKSPARANLQKLLLAASRREFDVVLFWSLDRFTREGTLATLNYLNRLESYGVRFRSFTEPFLDSCGIFKDVVIALLATLARQEVLRQSERVKAGMQRSKEWLRQGPYRRKRDNKLITRLGRPLSPVELEKVAALRLEGYSWRSIGERLDIPPTRARRAFRKLAERPLSAPTTNS